LPRGRGGCGGLGDGHGGASAARQMSWCDSGGERRVVP
jgi:hypothetical protein